MGCVSLLKKETFFKGMVVQEEINFLLIEDDDLDVQNLQRAFKKNNINYHLYVAKNGVEALEMIRGEGSLPLIPRPHVIMLDLNMPKMGGIEFLHELRKDARFKSLPVFILTSSDQEEDKIAAYNLNIAGYILKSLDFDEFLGTVKILDSYWTLCEYPNR